MIYMKLYKLSDQTTVELIRDKQNSVVIVVQL